MIGSIVSFIAWLLWCGAAFGASLDEGARAEGEIVLYSSLNNEQIVTSNSASGLAS